MGLSLWQIIILVVIVLLLFGPSRLPNLGKSLGEAIRGFKKGLDNDEVDVTTSARQQIPENESSSDSQKQTAQKEKDKDKA